MENNDKWQSDVKWTLTLSERLPVHTNFLPRGLHANLPLIANTERVSVTHGYLGSECNANIIYMNHMECKNKNTSAPFR